MAVSGRKRMDIDIGDRMFVLLCAQEVVYNYVIVG